MHKPIVLSIEDDVGLFRLLAMTLRGLPVDLRHAINGQEAQTMVASLRPELILLDISLPDQSGWETLDALKQQAILPPHVIVLTTHSTATHRVIGRLQEVTAFITKPFHRRELIDLVSQTLGLGNNHN
jgi:DNA-binding response OmpR family regulator